uniref:Uncharacterized protein n=1 Tax=Rhizophora mucronata TaxID=61149 RepID=A0A2P2NF56_RHIMU
MLPPQRKAKKKMSSNTTCSGNALLPDQSV